MTAHPSPVACSPAAFFDAMSLLASGLAIVTSRDSDGEPSGLLVASLCSYSAVPPSILVSVQCGCRSHAALLAAAHFGVHLLRSDQETAARAFGGRVREKFEVV